MDQNRLSRCSVSGSESNLSGGGAPLDDRVILSAIEEGCLESALRLMVQRGLNLNARVGSTYALHVAVNHVNFYFICILINVYFLQHQNTMIEFLLLNDAKIDNIDGGELGNTALHMAAANGHAM